MSFQISDPCACFLIGLIKRKGFSVDCVYLPPETSGLTPLDSLFGVVLRATPRTPDGRVIAVLARQVSRQLAELEAASRLHIHTSLPLAQPQEAFKLDAASKN